MSASGRSCVFCAIAAEEAERSVVYEDATTLAIMDIQPVTPGHTLVFPRRHAEFLGELLDVEGESLFAVARRCAAALRASTLRSDGINLFLADGEAAGQEVPHAHLHVFPRFEGDGFGLRIEGDYRIRAREELDETAASIRAAWS